MLTARLGLNPTKISPFEPYTPVEIVAELKSIQENSGNSHGQVRHCQEAAQDLGVPPSQLGPGKLGLPNPGG